MSLSVLSGLCRGADLLVMVAGALITGVLLRNVRSEPPWGEFLVVSCIAVSIAAATAERQGLYSLRALMDPFSQLARLGIVLVSASVASAGTLLLLHGRTSDLPYLVTQPLAWALTSGAMLLAVRSAVSARLHAHDRAGRLSTRIALIGANATSMQFIHNAADDRSVSIIGIYDDRATRLPSTVARTWIRGDVAALVDLARNHTVDAVVVALPVASPERIAEMRSRLAGIATDVFLVGGTGSPAHAAAKLTLLGSNPVQSVSIRPLKGWQAFKKATFDRVGSILFLVIAAPLMAAITVAVRLDSPGPVLFRQDREGLNGVLFTMLKFRTMHCHHSDESVQASQNDDRVTRTGYWLRRFSLDELPQLINVLRGDMSLVGPRPHLRTTRAGTRLFSEIVPHYQARHRMKPGLTGWAQVQGLRGETRTEKEIMDRVEQDLHYIDNWSLWLDTKILLRTFFSELFVSSSGRAY